MSSNSIRQASRNSSQSLGEHESSLDSSEYESPALTCDLWEEFIQEANSTLLVQYNSFFAALQDLHAKRIKYLEAIENRTPPLQSDWMRLANSFSIDNRRAVLGHYKEVGDDREVFVLQFNSPGLEKFGRVVVLIRALNISKRRRTQIITESMVAVGAIDEDHSITWTCLHPMNQAEMASIFIVSGAKYTITENTFGNVTAVTETLSNFTWGEVAESQE